MNTALQELCHHPGPQALASLLGHRVDAADLVHPEPARVRRGLCHGHAVQLRHVHQLVPQGVLQELHALGVAEMSRVDHHLLQLVAFLQREQGFRVVGVRLSDHDAFGLPAGEGDAGTRGAGSSGNTRCGSWAAGEERLGPPDAPADSHDGVDRRAQARSGGPRGRRGRRSPPPARGSRRPAVVKRTLSRRLRARPC